MSYHVDLTLYTQHIADLAKKRVSVRSNENLNKEFLRLINYVKDKCHEIEKVSGTEYPDNENKQAMAKAKNAGLENYVEVDISKRPSIDHVFALISRVRIKREKGFTCPIKTLALFAHDTEFSVLPNETPEIVDFVSKNCLKRQDVIALSRNGTLPKILSGMTEPLV